MTSDLDLVASLGRVGVAFFSGFTQLRESQRQAIPRVIAGENVLLACPTASGKTEAIFAPLIKRVLDLFPGAADGPRILAIAPTRALVNDLHSRLYPRLEELHLTCGRQTSDHRSTGRAPFLLITTPESLDSMLARRTRFDDGGRVSGHYLESVAALFIDEAHLFDKSPRGDQVQWLISRLRRVKESWRGKDNTKPLLQICAASATVSSPDTLAERLLGKGSIGLVVPGRREIQVLCTDPKPRWFELDSEIDGPSLAMMLPVLDSADINESVAGLLRSILTEGDGRAVRKILVFVATRAQCDELAALLNQKLANVRDIRVFGHHGSLDKTLREEAEEGFGGQKDVVLVATSTLEVGVDIGDVDAAVLVGAPPDTNALLQRIGRSGRRLGVTRVAALARSEVEARILGSMLVSARDGILDDAVYAPRWSVFVQQMASFIHQNGTLGRRLTDVLSLADSVHGDGSRLVAKQIAEHLVRTGHLAEQSRDGRLNFGEEWADTWGPGAMGMHGNLDSGAVGRPVVNAMTGEIIAHVPSNADVPSEISLGGWSWKVVHAGGELVLEQSAKARGSAIRYSSRAAPIRRNYCLHLALGLGLRKVDTLQFSHGDVDYWFHFGGSAYEAMIVALLPDMKSVRRLKGFALSGAIDRTKLDAIAHDPDRVTDAAEKMEQQLAGLYSPGPYHKLLPDDVRIATTVALFCPEEFCRWLSTLEIHPLKHGHPAQRVLIDMVEGVLAT